MTDQRFQLDWSSLTRDRYPPEEDVAGLLSDIASYRAPPGREGDWSGFETPYQDLIAVNPELVPHLIPLLVGIVADATDVGKWRVLSLVMETYQPGWERVFERAGGAALHQRIQSAFLAGLPIYVRCLSDPVPQTRELAACALGECATPKAVAALRERLPQEEDAQVRRYIRAWLKRAGVPEDDPIFSAVPEDPPWVPPPRDPDDDIPF